MKLSLKSEYAFLALYELSANYGKDLLKVENIASKYEMPAKFLEQILLQLKWAGIVKSKRGQTAVMPYPKFRKRQSLRM